MEKKELLEFYKEIHKTEFDRKNKIEEGISLPITIILGLVALIYSLLSEYDFKYLPRYNWLFVIPLFVCCILILASIISLSLVYASRKWYKDMPYADKIEKYRKELDEFWRLSTDNNENYEKLSRDDFTDYLIELYIAQSVNNTAKNDNKAKWNDRVKLSMLSSIFLGILTLPSFFYNFFNKPDKVYIVESTKLDQRVDSLIHIVQKHENTDSKRDSLISSRVNAGTKAKAGSNATNAANTSSRKADKRR